MLCNRDDVVVIIPVYRSRLNIYERVSLEQARRILGKYDMCFIAPNGLKIDYGELSRDITVVPFLRRFFQSPNTYSELLLTPEFYKTFIQYKYILVYQLDAFVFSDRLIEFCQQGYDYIGGPLERSIKGWREIECQVGNGGFSLRNVRACIRVCQEREKIFERVKENWLIDYFLAWEDVFFGFCGTLNDVDFKVPCVTEAIKFSVATDICHAFRKMPQWMPFGCHGWPIANYIYWKPIIERYGYHLPVGKGKQLIPSRLARRRTLLTKHILHRDQMYKCKEIFNEFTDTKRHLSVGDKEAVIYGWGNHGKLCYAFLRAAGVEVTLIYDAKGVGLKAPCEVAAPEKESIMNEKRPIFIATTAFEHEIAGLLSEIGLKKDKDYFYWSEIMDVICEKCMVLN